MRLMKGWRGVTVVAYGFAAMSELGAACGRPFPSPSSGQWWLLDLFLAVGFAVVGFLILIGVEES